MSDVLKQEADHLRKSPKAVDMHCHRCGETRRFVRAGFENRLNGEAVFNCANCTATVTYSRLVSDTRIAEAANRFGQALERYAERFAELQAAAATHEQLIDAAGEKIATLRFVLTQIRGLSKAGRLDEIFTLANRALEECK